MAPRINWWLAATIGGCVAVAIAYVPPRGTARQARDAALARTRRPTAEAERAIALAADWRQADLEMQLAEQRITMARALDEARSHDRRTVVLTIDAQIPDDIRQRFAATLDSAWDALELGTTKIGVGVVLTSGVDSPGARRPRRLPRGSPAFAFPDSLDRSTCVSLTTISGYGPWLAYATRDRASILRRSLGPCAFYAAFGKPSPRIERWLAARRFDLALDAVWDRTSARQRNGFYGGFLDLDLPGRQGGWVWFWLYQAPPQIVGCIAGRAEACVDYATLGANADGRPPTVVATNFERRGPPLPGATQTLSDALHEFGPARFARFWTSDLRPDSAFAVAMDTTLGQWLASRQLRLTPRLPLGPAAPLSASLLGVLLAALGFGLAAVVAGRRQVG